MEKKFQNHLFGHLDPQNFVLLEKIASGASGKVCKYENPQIPDKFFAIKQILISQDNPESAAKQEIEILKEINNLAKVNSYSFKPSSFPDYYGYYKKFNKCKEPIYYLVFNYFPISFREFLQNQKIRIEFSQLKLFYDSLLFGLSFLQSIDISHRDLKPENLALDESNNIKILDFGFARDFSQIKNTSELTLGGTESYMAPEMIEAYFENKDKKFKDTYKSDVFSFGLIVLEMGTLKKISHNRDIEVLRKAIKRNLKKFERNYDGIEGSEKEDFDQIYESIKKILLNEPEERPDFINLFKSGLIKEKLIYHIYIENLRKKTINKILKKGSVIENKNDKLIDENVIIKNISNKNKNDVSGESVTMKDDKSMKELKKKIKTLEEEKEDTIEGYKKNENKLQKNLEKSENMIIELTKIIGEINYQLELEKEKTKKTQEELSHLQKNYIELQNVFLEKEEELKISENLVQELTNQCEILNNSNPKEQNPKQITCANQVINNNNKIRKPTTNQSESSQMNLFMNAMMKGIIEMNNPNEITEINNAKNNRQVALEKITAQSEMKITTKIVNLKFGDECFNCKKKLKLADPQYYCYFCKVWYCEKCGEKDESMSQVGSLRFIDPHNLVWINVSKEDGMKNIDEYKFGKGYFFNRNIQNYGGICNCCRNNIDGGFRYICLSCRPGPKIKGVGFVDVCHMCMNILKGKNSSYKKVSVLKMIMKLEEGGHDVESHVFLRICLGDNYYDY